MANPTTKPLVVISHVAADQRWLGQLRPQLEVLEQYSNVRVWDETEITAGADRYQELSRQMHEARIVVCLISADYLVALAVYEEFDYLLEKRRNGGLLLIPILVRPCVWRVVPWLKPIKMFPLDGQPISTKYQGQEDEVFAEVASYIQDRLDADSGQPTFVVNVQTDTTALLEQTARDVLLRDEPLRIATRVELPSGIREDIGRLPETGSRLFGRRNELAIMDHAWQSPDVHVLSLIAWGGVGKSTLVNRWLEQSRLDGYRGARRVFAWSFYSQGIKEQVSSSDLFFDTALRWFGAAGFEQLSIWDKAERLAKLIREQPTLLVLDGVEPLQSGAKADNGVFRDGGLKWLIRELVRDNNGLCIVSSRVPLVEFANETTRVDASKVKLDDSGQALLPNGSSHLQLDLETISPEAGRALLKTEYVQGSNEELEQATREFGCHALAVTLLGAWLHQIPGHHVSELRRIPDLPIPDAEGRHARRVLAAFEALLNDTRELDLLRIMGLFDRPAKRELIEAVLDGERIEGLTSQFSGDFRSELSAAVDRLRQLRLLAPASEHRASEVDCHPLVREHFAVQLRERNPEGFRAAHQRLYEHLCATTPDKPQPTLDDLQPLYQAVAHGCLAGLQQEACDEVYYARIARRNEAYAVKKLGAFGSELSAVACFFEQPWGRVSRTLTEADQAWLLNEAAFRLRALGRLTEALEPMRAVLTRDVEKESWKEAAVSASNLSELELTLGEASAAVEDASRSVTYADRSGDAFERYSERTAHADALHQSGRRSDAETLFREAEQMQAAGQPAYPLLYLLRGFQYCDLLLAPNERAAWRATMNLLLEISDSQSPDACRGIARRSAQTLKWAQMGGQGSLLDIALDHLTLGRALLYESLLAGSEISSSQSQISDIQAQIDQAVSGLRSAGDLPYLPHGLLTRAWQRYLTGARRGESSAAADLDEAWEIASRGSMRLFMADILLTRARLFSSFNRDPTGSAGTATARSTAPPALPVGSRLNDYPWESPAADLAAAEELINACGYHRRDEELADAKLVLLGKA